MIWWYYCHSDAWNSRIYIVWVRLARDPDFFLEQGSPRCPFGILLSTFTVVQRPVMNLFFSYLNQNMKLWFIIRMLQTLFVTTNVEFLSHNTCQIAFQGQTIVFLLLRAWNRGIILTPFIKCETIVGRYLTQRCRGPGVYRYTHTSWWFDKFQKLRKHVWQHEKYIFATGNFSTNVDHIKPSCSMVVH